MGFFHPTKKITNYNTRFLFISNVFFFFFVFLWFFSIFSWIELQMLLRCCLIHVSIIILTHFLFSLYLYPCLDLCLFMSYLCDPFFIFIFIFIMINHVISSVQTQLFFCLFFRICPHYFWMIMWVKNVNSFQMSKVQPQGVA